MKTDSIENSILDHYSSRTLQSKANASSAKAFLPGGDTRFATYFPPYPTYIKRGEGCNIYDCDGNRYIDFLNNYSALIHGHAHPDMVEAICRQTRAGTVFAAPTEEQIHLAEHICERTPSIDRVRFCNSGTESTMLAIQLARAITGRDLILKMEGGYHGSHDYVKVGETPNINGEPLTAAPSNLRGVPNAVSNTVLLARFNDLESTREILKAKHQDIAAIIMEPMVHTGGMIPPNENYLRGMRTLADEFNVLLIFDEVLSYRLAKGGLQSTQDVKADITTLGKIIGGGIPVGAVGGSEEYMRHFDPTNPAFIKHSGTFNGNSLAMTAGLTALRLYDQTAVDHVNSLGSMLRDGINQAFISTEIKGQATGMGSLAQIHWTDEQLSSPWEASLAKVRALKLPKLLHLELLGRGIAVGPRGNCCISTPMSETEIQVFIDELRQILIVLRPYMKDHTPHLLLNSKQVEVRRSGRNK